MSTELQHKCSKCLQWVSAVHEKYCGFCGNKLPEMPSQKAPSAPNIYGKYRFNGQELIAPHDFGTIDPENEHLSQRIAYQIHIHNPNSKSLEIEIQSYPEWLSLSPDTDDRLYVVESNQSVSIQIFPDFKKAASGNYEGPVQLKTNDSRNEFRNIDIPFQMNVLSPPSEFMNDTKKVHKDHHDQSSDFNVSDTRHDHMEDAPEKLIQKPAANQEQQNKMQTVEIFGEEYIEIPKANVKYLGVAEVTIQKFYVSKEPIKYDNYMAVIDNLLNIPVMPPPELLTMFQKLQTADPQPNDQGYVMNISWQDAAHFCDIKSILYYLDNQGILKKNKKMLDKIKNYAKSPALPFNKIIGFRLPTEFELKHIYDYLKTNNPLQLNFHDFYEYTSGSYLNLQDLSKFDGEQNPLPFHQNLEKCIFNTLKLRRKPVCSDGHTIYQPLFRNIFQIN